MGYDVTRFQGEVDEDLLCPICSGVLEEPVQVSQLLMNHKLLPVSGFFRFLIFWSHYNFRPHTASMPSAMPV